MDHYLSFFDKITDDDKQDELCAELTPREENVEFLRSYIRCAGNDFGTVTLFIRPIRSVRMELSRAANKESFDEIRKKSHYPITNSFILPDLRPILQTHRSIKIS